MSDTQSLNATFFAFRKREGGGVLLKASIAFALVLLLIFVVFGTAAWFALGGEAFFSWYSDLMAAAASGQMSDPPPPPNLSGVFLLVLLEFVFLFVFFVVLAAYEATCVRWMLRGDRPGALGLHFGADMWRVYGTYWVWLLFALLGWIAFAVLMGVLGAVVMSTLGDMGGWVVFLVCVGYMIAWLYAWVRLSPASATSIGLGVFQPLKAWRVSRGRFWALFGSYLLSFILYFIVVSVLSGILFGAFYAQLFQGLDWTLAQSDPEAFARGYQQASMQAMQNLFASPAAIAMYVGGQIALYAVALTFYVIWYGIESRAVQTAIEEGKIEPAPAT